MLRFTRRHLRFSPAGTIAVVALVFAMTGGAWAVTHHSSHSHKAKRGPVGPPGPVGLAGPMGLTGPVGPAGPLGPVGPEGPAGSAGLAGSVGPTGPIGPEGPQGVQGDTGAVGAQGPAGPQGKEGSPWTVEGTLPSEKTETGTWSAGKFATEGVQTVSLSFSLPLPLALTTGHVHFLKVGEGGTPECPGSVAEPKAAPGNLCLYSAKLEKLTFSELEGFPHSFASGAVIGFLAEPGGIGLGTWAVTAEEPEAS